MASGPLRCVRNTPAFVNRIGVRGIDGVRQNSAGRVHQISAVGVHKSSAGGVRQISAPNKEGNREGNSKSNNEFFSPGGSHPESKNNTTEVFGGWCFRPFGPFMQIQSYERKVP